jgi:glyoxylase-like metal-dependent hydrolase (beta-lactamase superfamily II)
MCSWLRLTACVVLSAACATVSQEEARQTETSSSDAISAQWCDELPRHQYSSLERIDIDSDWFEVWDVGQGVFALYEPKQWQEKVSYLILGTERALLFDTGMGIASISDVVGLLTTLPVTVLNSDTHPDHTGGNSEFASVMAMDTDFTRERAEGYSNEQVRGELAPEALCGTLPAGVSQENYRIPPWSASEVVDDGYVVDLGGRTLEIVAIPGHTPDAIALLDPAAGYLWTGDSFYEGTIWLFSPETDLDDYASSVERLAALVPRITSVLPAHNAPIADPIRLVELRDAVHAVRNGSLTGTPGDGGTIRYPAGEFSLLLAR